MSLLSESLRSKLIPWSQYNPEQRVIVASSQMHASEMPEDVQLSQQKITGKRVVVKNRRYHNNTRNFLALWPEDHLNEMTQLKLVCVLSGYTSFQVGEYAINCGEGHFIFLPPRLPHPDSSRQNLPDAPWQNACDLLYIILAQHAVQCWIDRCRRGQAKVEKLESSLFQNEHVIYLFRILMEKMIAGDSVSLKHSMSLLPVFFEMLFEEIKGKHYILVGGTDSTQILTTTSINFEQQLRQYIIGNIGKPLTIESVAREMYLSRAQFARRVRRETGKTFVEILTECRLQEAKVLLGGSDWTINGVAESVGYKNPSYFRRIFQQQTGVTPGEFRKRAPKN
jgi:AraC-like DNA-binding protein